MTVMELQDRLAELERQVARLRGFLESYKTGMLDYDELMSVVQPALARIRDGSEPGRRHQAA